jgi:hypothetical protein
MHILSRHSASSSDHCLLFIDLDIIKYFNGVTQDPKSKDQEHYNKEQKTSRSISASNQSRMDHPEVDPKDNNPFKTYEQRGHSSGAKDNEDTVG